MTEDELRQKLKSRGWVLFFQARRKTGKRYAYAKRRKGSTIQTRYICPEDQITDLDEQTVEQRISSSTTEP